MDVTVVGSCNVDLISYVSRLPIPGETLQGTKFAMGMGGKGANQCVMSRKLGAKTAMVAKVGVDTFGDNFLKAFKDLDVCTDHISRTDQAMTGVAPITVDDSGQNSIIIVPGANLLVNDADLEAAEATISNTKVVICQLEIEPKVTLAALTMAKKHGVKTILNPAPAISLDKAFFENADVFCPNETEIWQFGQTNWQSMQTYVMSNSFLSTVFSKDQINHLSHNPKCEILTGIHVSTVDDAKLAVIGLQKLGCKDVIITLGEMGCVVSDNSSGDVVHVSAPKVDAKDTTGAGDAFIGALAFYLSTMPGLGLVESAKRAVQIASVSVQRLGTQTSMPFRSELPEHLFV